MNIKQIITLIEKDILDVNSEIRIQLKSEITLIRKLVTYIINSGGKRIRPIITLLTARALQYKKKQHIIIATLIEFIHTATLLHDDVIDKSRMRRGKVTANIIFGNEASILVGDFIYTRAFQMMTQLKSTRILSLISDTVNIIAEGEICQLMYCNNPKISINNYMNVICSKTARLFEVASQSSAILAGANPSQEIALKKFGRHIGIAFQLIDDVLDYSASQKNFDKHIGSDLNEGKPTLPLLHALHHGTPEQTLLIRQAIEQGNKRHLLKSILDIMNQHGSLEYTRQCAKTQIYKAIFHLKKISPSLYRHALEKLARSIIQ